MAVDDLPILFELLEDERQPCVDMKVAMIGTSAAEPRIANHPRDALMPLDRRTAWQEIELDIGERYDVLLLHRMDICGTTDIFLVRRCAEMDGMRIVREDPRDRRTVPPT